MATISLTRANRFLASVADPVSAAVLARGRGPLLCGLPGGVAVPVGDKHVFPYAVALDSWVLNTLGCPDSLDDILEVGTTFTIRAVKTRTWLFPSPDGYGLHHELAKPDKDYYVYSSSLFVPRCPDLASQLWKYSTLS